MLPARIILFAVMVTDGNEKWLHAPEKFRSADINYANKYNFSCELVTS